MQIECFISRELQSNVSINEKFHYPIENEVSSATIEKVEHVEERAKGGLQEMKDSIFRFRFRVIL